MTRGPDLGVVQPNPNPKPHTLNPKSYTLMQVECCDMATEGSRVVSGDNHGMISV